MIFALRKTTLRKRETIWRETVRPFLLSVALTGIGGFIVLLCLPASLQTLHQSQIGVTHIIVHSSGGYFAAAIVGLVLSSTLLLLLLVVLRGRKTPPQYQPAQPTNQTAQVLLKGVLVMAMIGGAMALFALFFAAV